MWCVDGVIVVIWRNAFWRTHHFNDSGNVGLRSSFVYRVKYFFVLYFVLSSIDYSTRFFSLVIFVFVLWRRLSNEDERAMKKKFFFYDQTNIEIHSYLFVMKRCILVWRERKHFNFFFLVGISTILRLTDAYFLFVEMRYDFGLVYFYVNLYTPQSSFSKAPHKICTDGIIKRQTETKIKYKIYFSSVDFYRLNENMNRYCWWHWKLMSRSLFTIHLNILWVSMDFVFVVHSCVAPFDSYYILIYRKITWIYREYWLKLNCGSGIMSYMYFEL